MKTGKNLTAKKFHRAGAIAGCVQLKSHDIGRAIVGRKSVWFAWGDNLNAEDAGMWRTQGFDTVKCGQFFSIVIPVKVMARLFPAIIWIHGRDRAILARQIKTNQRAGQQQQKESEEMKRRRIKDLWDSIPSLNRSIIASRTELGCNPDIFKSWYGIPPSRQDVYARAISMGLASDK